MDDDDDDLQPLAHEVKPRGILLPVVKKEGGEVERAGVTQMETVRPKTALSLGYYKVFRFQLGGAHL